MAFPIVMYGRESWTIKKTECWRTDDFKLWCWRRLFRVPWTARRSNQSILKEISTGRTDAEAEAPILWLPDVRSQLIGKDPDAGKDWRWEEKGTTEDEVVGWHHRLSGLSLSELRAIVNNREAWRAAVCGVAGSDVTEQQPARSSAVWPWVRHPVFLRSWNEKPAQGHVIQREASAPEMRAYPLVSLFLLIRFDLHLTW